MKQLIEQNISQALATLQSQGLIPDSIQPKFTVEYTRDLKHGDFACNAAMMLAKPAKRNPREIAQALVGALPHSEHIAKTDIAGPGFINFFLSSKAHQHLISQITEQGDDYGKTDLGKGSRIHMEFVSANPTGPLHVGHGRHAAFGASLANILEAVGYQVHREYYVNDAGRQMHILATSLWLRYLEACGESFPFPSNAYKGEYVSVMAKEVKADHGDAFQHAAAAVFEDIPQDLQENGSGDKEAHIDALIVRAKTLLGADNYQKLFDKASQDVLRDIQDDLQDFGVEYQQWFSEQSLRATELDAGIKKLQDGGHCYEKEGALWFRSTDFGDDKDRVLLRDNGEPTYFAADVAYHYHKITQGYDRIIDVLGSDHHGYVPRLRACIQALGFSSDCLHAPLVQFVNLFREGQKLSMSTRSGTFITLRELREEVGNDAARFFYITRDCEQHLDFDLDLAKSRSHENPVFYIQYAYARICSVLRQLDERQLSHDRDEGFANIAALNTSHEQAMLRQLMLFPDTLVSAATNDEPHLVANYLRDLATAFHSYYNAHAFIVDDDKLRNARLCLIKATQQVFGNAANILRINTPETM